MANEAIVYKQSDAQAIIEAVKDLEGAAVQEVGKEGQAVLILPRGKTATSIKPYLDEYRQAPERRKGTSNLTTQQSFIALVNRFKDPGSAIFADVVDTETPRLVAVLNYHDSVKPKPADDSPSVEDLGPRFGDHRAIYKFPLSDEWAAWTEERQPMDQRAFAEFLEEHIADVMDPGKVGELIQEWNAQHGITLAGPQRLFELSRGLTIRVGRVITQAVTLNTGEARISFEERHDGGEANAPVGVPGGFAIQIPVFRGDAAYQLPVRLRYRQAGSGIVWWCDVQRIDPTFDDAVRIAAEEVQRLTALPLYYGTPEG